MKYTIADSLANFLTEGEGVYQVLEAKDSKSKSSGSDMIVLRCLVTDSKNKQLEIFKYITMAWQLRQFAESAGLLNKFNTENMCATDCLRAKGRCLIKTEVSQDPNYDDKSIIAKFLKPSAVSTKASHAGDDPLPFNDLLPPVDDVPF